MLGKLLKEVSTYPNLNKLMSPLEMSHSLRFMVELKPLKVWAPSQIVLSR